MNENEKSIRALIRAVNAKYMNTMSQLLSSYAVSLYDAQGNLSPGLQRACQILENQLVEIYQGTVNEFEHQ